MDNQESRVGNETPVSLPKERNITSNPAKADLKTFLTNWKDVLALEADPVSRLSSMVRTGFQGEVTGEDVAQLLVSLSERRILAERLALPIAVQERFGKLKPLARRLLAEL